MNRIHPQPASESKRLHLIFSLVLRPPASSSLQGPPNLILSNAFDTRYIVAQVLVEMVFHFARTQECDPERQASVSVLRRGRSARVKNQACCAKMCNEQDSPVRLHDLLFLE